MDAITNKKINQMKFAAKLFADVNKQEGVDLRLLVATMSGVKPEVIDIIEL